MFQFRTFKCRNDKINYVSINIEEISYFHKSKDIGGEYVHMELKSGKIFYLDEKIDDVISGFRNNNI